MTVVDADTLIRLILDRSDQVRASFLADPDWAAPPLWHSDFRGALARRIEKGTLTLERAVKAYEAACRIIAGNEPEPDARLVLELTMTAGLDGYDAEYVAVARQLGVPLLTAEDYGDLASPP